MDEWSRKVLEYIRESPSPYIGERTIAAALGTNRRRIRIALDALIQAGRLDREIRTDDQGFVLMSKYTILEGSTHDRL
jgi:hypothetical protein